MKNITLLLFAFISLHTIGQKKFAQLDHELPTANEYRTASGAPGHRYYQQKADYKMSIVIDDKTPIDTEEMLLKRDRDRWELDSASAVDH